MTATDWASLAKEIDQLVIDIEAIRQSKIAAEAARPKRRLQRSDIFKLMRTAINPNK